MCSRLEQNHPFKWLSFTIVFGMHLFLMSLLILCLSWEEEIKGDRRTLRYLGSFDVEEVLLNSYYKRLYIWWRVGLVWRFSNFRHNCIHVYIIKVKFV